jgi:hypothetical protein
VTNHISSSVWVRPGFLAIIFLPKLSPQKELENVNVVARCAVCNEFIPPFIIFKGKYTSRTYPGSEIAMTILHLSMTTFFCNGFNIFRSNPLQESVC